MRPFAPLALLFALACAPKPGAAPAADSAGAAADAARPDSVPPDSTPPAAPAVALEGTVWRLVELVGRPMPARPDSARAPGFTLLVDGHKVQGSAGCNRMTGTYQLTGTSLKFGPLATTRMACPAMDVEQAFLLALDGTTRYEIVGSSLTLYGAAGALARLEAPPPA
jgi:copper homeostasis protein (lipoprotein)